MKRIKQIRTDLIRCANDDGNADAVGQSLWRRTMTRIERINADYFTPFGFFCPCLPAGRFVGDLNGLMILLRKI